MTFSPADYNFCLQEITRDSGVICRRTTKFENPTALGFCGCGLLSLSVNATEPCPNRGQRGTCERRER